MISKSLFAAALVLAGAVSNIAQAAEKISVVTTITELAWVANEIGQNKLVDAQSLLNGTENPHFVDAVPEFIRLVSDAQVVCMVGLELEVGWMPAVLKRSGNADVQQGGKGYCEAGKGIAVLDKATGPIDRSMGDVHPGGNPHFWMSPIALGEAAGEVAAALTRVDPAHAADYAKGLADLRTKLKGISDENKERLKPAMAALSGNALIEYHKEFAYFLENYGLKSYGSVEEKPGVPPSAGRLAEVALAAKAAGVKMAIAMPYSPEKLLKRFSELSGIPVVVFQGSLLKSDPKKTYADLQKENIDKLLSAVKVSH